MGLTSTGGIKGLASGVFDWIGRAGDALKVRITGSDVTKPNEDTLEGTATVAGAGQMAELTDLTPYKTITLVVRAITTSIDLTVSADGTNYSGNLNFKDVGDGTYKAITAIGVYEVPTSKIKSVILTAVGAGAATIDWIAGTN